MRKSQNPTGSIQEKLKELQRLLRKREKELYSIQRVSKAVGSTLNIDRLLLLIMREITVLMEAERSTLYIVDHEKNELWAKVAIDAEISEIRQIIGKGISGTVALTGETINLQDVYADPRFDPVRGSISTNCNLYQQCAIVSTIRAQIKRNGFTL